MKTLCALLLACFGMAAQAQTVGAQQGQTSTLQGQSTAAIEQGAVVVQSIGSPELAYKKVENESSGSLKTVPSAIAPGIYNSSGQYTCFGAVSGAGSVLGFGGSGGKTIDMAQCYRLHLMDKAAMRAASANQAAAASKGAEAVAFREQASKYAKVWDAGFCMFDDGKAMFEAALLECPQAAREAEVRRAQATMEDRKAAQAPVDPFIAASGRTWPSQR